MKTAVSVIIAFILGTMASSVWRSSDVITIKVIENQECSDPEYHLEMETHTALVKGDQIEFFNISVARHAEALFHIAPIFQPSNGIRYRIRARYSDCQELISEERIVQRGWLLYETIENEGIRHAVRSK